MLTEPVGTQRKQKGSAQAGIQLRHRDSFPVSTSLLWPWQTQQMGSQQGPGSQQAQALLMQDNDPASRSLADRGTQDHEILDRAAQRNLPGRRAVSEGAITLLRRAVIRIEKSEQPACLSLYAESVTELTQPNPHSNSVRRRLFILI